VRHRVVQRQIDGGLGPAATADELAEIKALTAENRRLREDVEMLRAGAGFRRGGARPRQPLMMGLIDSIRAEGHRGHLQFFTVDLAHQLAQPPEAVTGFLRRAGRPW
jgi:hypothetical protein